MTVELIDYVPSLKREVQPPGTDLFSGVTDQQWIGWLSDAFWEARLDGFLAGYQTVDGPNGPASEIDPIDVGGPDIPRQDIALIIIYAGIRVLRNRILNMNTAFRAKAGPVEFEQQNSATMLAEMLKGLKATKDRLLELSDEMAPVLILDAFSERLMNTQSYFGSQELTSGPVSSNFIAPPGS